MCEPPPTQVYAAAELFLMAIACVIAFGAGGGFVWWRMTGLKGRHR
jgi:hypothetical protein